VNGKDRRLGKTERRDGRRGKGEEEKGTKREGEGEENGWENLAPPRSFLNV